MADRPVTPVNEIVLLTGTSNPKLAGGVANLLSVPLCKRVAEKFQDGEVKFESGEDVRGKDVFILQDTGQPDSNQIMVELMVGSIRSSAWRITLIIPYLGYARQDRRHKARVPISLVSRLRNLIGTGIDGIQVLDPHTFIEDKAEALNPRIQAGTLFARAPLIEWLLRHDLSKVTIASPDTGGAPRARFICQRLWDNGYGVEFGLGYKVGSSEDGVEKINLFGDFQDRDVYFIDDMASTGTTANKASAAAKERGAKSVTFIAVHPVLANLDVCHAIASGPIDRFVTTNSLDISPEALAILDGKHEYLPIDPLLAKVIRNIHECRSLSALYELDGYKAALMDR